MQAVTTAGRRLHALVQQHGPLCRGVGTAAVTFVALAPSSKKNSKDHDAGGAGADAGGSSARPPTPLTQQLRSAALRLLAAAVAGAFVATATRGSAADVTRRAALRRIAEHAGLGELLGAPLVARATTAAVATGGGGGGGGGGARARALDLGGGLSLPVPRPSAQRVRLAFEVTGSGGAAGGRGGAAAGALVAADAFLSPLAFLGGRARFRRLYVDVPCESASWKSGAGGVERLFLGAEEAVCAGAQARRGAGLAGLVGGEEQREAQAREEEAAAVSNKAAAHVEPPPFARITLVGTPVPTSARSPVRDAVRLALFRAAQEEEAARAAGAAGAAAAQDEAETLPELEAVRAAREASRRALELGAGLLARARAKAVAGGSSAEAEAKGVVATPTAAADDNGGGGDGGTTPTSTTTPTAAAAGADRSS